MEEVEIASPPWTPGHAGGPLGKDRALCVPLGPLPIPLPGPRALREELRNKHETRVVSIVLTKGGVQGPAEEKFTKVSLERRQASP